jgi:hypothetical protein
MRLTSDSMFDSIDSARVAVTVTLVNGSFGATSARRGNGSGTFQSPRDTSCGTAVPLVENAEYDAIAGARRWRVRSRGKRFCGVPPER